jgi:hypothetical protein
MIRDLLFWIVNYTRYTLHTSKQYTTILCGYYFDLYCHHILSTHASPIYCPRLSEKTLRYVNSRGLTCASAIASRCLTGKICSGGSLPRHGRFFWDQSDLKSSTLLREQVGPGNGDWLSGNFKLCQVTITTLSGSSGTYDMIYARQFVLNIVRGPVGHLLFLNICLIFSTQPMARKHSKDWVTWETCYFSKTCLQLATKICFWGKITCSLSACRQRGTSSKTFNFQREVH